METPLAFIDVAGTRTAYREEGDGFPLLLLHGGDYRSFSSSHDWQPVLRLLAGQGFRAIAVDKLGQGYTDLPGKGAPSFTMQAVYEHVAGFADALGLGNFAVAGHSRGALPAALLAMDQPERVTALVVIDSNTLGPVSSLTPTDFYPRVYAGMSEPPTAEQARREMDLNSFSTAHVDDATIQVRTEIARQPKAATARQIMNAGGFREVFLPDAERLREAALGRIRGGELAAETLIIWGRNDPSAPLGIALELFGLVADVQPATELHVINQAGHYTYREHPARVAGLVAGFVKPAERPQA